MNRLKDVYNAINEFRDEITESRIGHKIDKIILYGSVAKGRYKGEDSDIDIMVFSKYKDIDEDILDIETEISLKYGIDISALMMSMDELLRHKRAGYIFPYEVLSGEVIYERRKRRIKDSKRDVK